MAMSLNFRFWEKEGLYYQCGENNGADQLCAYHTADPRIVFANAKRRLSHVVARRNNSALRGSGLGREHVCLLVILDMQGTPN